MFAKAFSNPHKAKWVIQGAGLIWFLGCFSLLYFYGIELSLALADSGLFTLGFMLGVFVLERIFSFYIPKGGNNWLLLIIPLLVSLITVWAHACIQSWVFDADPDYIQFLLDHRFLRWAVLGLAEVLVALIAIVVSKLEQQEESQQRETMMNELSKEAELTQLRQQLQPHFLFNSLNSINALVVSQPQKAREMVIQLSEFLRGTIRKDPQKWVSVSEELAYLRLYLDIEKVRFGHRLKINFEIEEGAESLQLPQLLIQPLLENAIKYGLYGVTEEASINLSISKNQNYLMISISNPYDSEVAPAKGTGFGLNSVERRLFLVFGRKDLLETKQMDSNFNVKLKIPQRND
ncbi:MAG: two-component system LytT family sensor kinase [Planctomycetota bacterium]